MRPNWVFRGVYVLLVGGFLTIAHTLFHATRHGAPTEQGQAHLVGFVLPGGPLFGFAILVVGVVVAVYGIWAPEPPSRSPETQPREANP